MKISDVTIIGTLLVLFAAAAWSQESSKPWEEYGLSQTEWKVIADSGISKSKVEDILQAGIGIMEYVQKPWKRYGISERIWIEKRRLGKTEYDIELEAQKGVGLPTPTSEPFAPEKLIPEGNLELAKSFFLPGHQQLRIDHKSRGKTMAALAIGSLAATVVLSTATGRIEPAPMFAVLVPDMLWSFFDFKLAAGRQQQP
ncbi:MAG: hypothetical protein MUF22_05115 [Chitinispirillaceae bacterium]|jgi:hypothetical protein|nr:hypothetical protein [Chitinispirillaceae bacterium]